MARKNAARADATLILPEPLPVVFLGSTEKDLQKLTAGVQDVFVTALEMARIGRTHSDAKPLKGYGGVSAQEVKADADGDTFRLMYLIKVGDALYVLLVIKKKSTSGIGLDKQDERTLQARITHAGTHHQANYAAKKKG